VEVVVVGVVCLLVVLGSDGFKKSFNPVFARPFNPVLPRPLSEDSLSKLVSNDWKNESWLVENLCCIICLLGLAEKV
jgi:hypothetical protein